MNIKYLLFIVILSLQTPICNAQIYHCLNESGRTIFKDKECGSNEDSVKVIDDLEEVKSVEKEVVEKVTDNDSIEDGKPGKLIFENHKRLASPYTIKVNEVRVITETDDTLVVDVIYTYKHKIPAKQIKIFVTPNHGYWSTNQIQVSEGKNVGRASIGLSKSNMKKDRVTRSSTDTIGVRFEHYKPKKYMGVIWSETIKYKKNWKLKK